MSKKSFGDLTNLSQEAKRIIQKDSKLDLHSLIPAENLIFWYDENGVSQYSLITDLVDNHE